MSRPASAAPPTAALRGVNTETKVLDTHNGRILCIADIRGRLSGLNELAREANAVAIIHTGDFGFFESSSLDRINDRALRHLTMYSPLIPAMQRTHLLSPDNTAAAIRSTVSISLLSEFPLLLSGQLKLDIPVYTTWGACEDVLVLEKFRTGAYTIPNLTVLDEATTRVLDVGGVKLRLLGLGGALVSHKMFDNGDGAATIAGGQGTMWASALQIGELVDTAQRVFDPSETRLLVTHASPGREGILAQLALVVKADLTISAGLHFRYTTSYNEFSVQGDFEGFRRKLAKGKEDFDKVWESVKTQVDAVVDDNQRVLLDKALSVVDRVPAGTAEEASWKNCWNWNLCDAAYGSMVLGIREGRISAEIKSQGFNYAYRRTATTPTPTTSTAPLPKPVDTKPATPAPVSAPTPPPAAKKSPAKKEESVTSPVEDLKSPSTGARTPKSGKPSRNPWTIFMRIPLGPAVGITDTEIRDFYGDAKDGITKVNVLPPYGRPARLVYVEFGDEESMKKGLSVEKAKFKDTVPEVKQAQEKENSGPPGRGGGRGGRGGRGGGFAARGLAAAGITRKVDGSNHGGEN